MVTLTELISPTQSAQEPESARIDRTALTPGFVNTTSRFRNPIKGTFSSLITLILALAIGLSAAVGVATFQQQSNNAQDAELAVTRLRVVLDQFERIGAIIRADPSQASSFMGEYGTYGIEAQSLLAKIKEVAPGETQQQLEATYLGLVDTMVRIRVLIGTNSPNLGAYIESNGVPAREAFDQALLEADAVYHREAVQQQRLATIGMWGVLILAAVGTTGFALVNERLRRKTTLMLMSQEAHFRSLVQYGADLITVVDPDLTVRFHSPSIGQLLGYQPEEIERKPFTSLVHPDDLTSFERLLDASRANPGTAVTGELRLTRIDGTVRTVEVIANNLTTHPDVRGFVLTSHDISERIEEAKQVAFQAMHDELTGLPNRRLFMDRLTQGIARTNRSDTTIAVIFVDLNDFKNINDTYGHETGDTVLRLSGQRIQQVIRQGDTAARMGGDEFVVMLEVRTSDEAEIIADRLMQALHAPFLLDYTGHELSLTISLGVATYDPTEFPEDLLRRADLAMYSGKHAGRSDVVMFHPTMEPAVLRERALAGTTT